MTDIKATFNSLQLPDGQDLSFGEDMWIDDEWNHEVQAKSDTDATEEILVATTVRGDEITQSIPIERILSGTIEKQSGDVYTNRPFRIDYKLFDSENDPLVRLPSGLVSIQVDKGEEDVTSEIDFIGKPENLPYSSTFDVTVHEGGTYQFKLVDNSDGRVIHFISVTMKRIGGKKELAEAINERNLFKKRDSNYTDKSTLEELRTGAISCVNGYCKDTFDASGNFHTYSNQEILNRVKPIPSDPSQYDQWINETYGFICGVNHDSGNSYLSDGVGKEGVDTQTRKYQYNEDTGENEFTESWSSTQSRAKGEMSRKFNSSSGAIGNYLEVSKYAVYYDASKPGVAQASCSMYLKYARASSYLSSVAFDYKVKFLFFSKKPTESSSSEFDNMGFGVPSANTYFLYGKYAYANKNDIFKSDFIPATNISNSVKWQSASVAKKRGFLLFVPKFLTSIMFKHR